MPLLPIDLSVLAIKTAMSPTVAWVMKFLVPFNTHSPFSSTAVVWTPAASEPAPGSVRPQAPILVPLASGTRNFCFCSSVPARKIWFEQSELCAATVIPIEPSTAAISSIAST